LPQVVETDSDLLDGMNNTQQATTRWPASKAMPSQVNYELMMSIVQSLEMY
jgi:hypothetical protein